MAVQGGTSPKLQVLCLHGYLQNSEVFSAKIGSLRKGLKSRVDFHFVDAPHSAILADEAEVTDSGGTADRPLAWWTWKETEPGMRPSLSSQYSGWKESAHVLLAKLKELPHIDGILGFSQGSTASALLLAFLAQQSDISKPYFAILIAGFLPKDEVYAARLRDASIKANLLMVHGDSDALVPRERSQQLQEVLEVAGCKVTRWTHSGAHMVPTCSGEFKAQLIAFLEAQK